MPLSDDDREYIRRREAREARRRELEDAAGWHAEIAPHIELLGARPVAEDRPDAPTPGGRCT